MMQNLLVTSFSPLLTKNETNCWENRPFTTVWPENIQQKQKDLTTAIKKKKRVRTAFTTDQILALEQFYSNSKYVCAASRAEIANALKISDKCVKIWFQNRRMKDKKESPLTLPTDQSLESSADSSSESVSIDSISGSTPPLVTVKETTTEPTSYYPDTTYQLPTYCNTNELQSNYDGIASSGSAEYFYNERTVYPTQYYPHDINFSYTHGYDQYANEGGNYWTGSQYPY